MRKNRISKARLAHAEAQIARAAEGRRQELLASIREHSPKDWVPYLGEGNVEAAMSAANEATWAFALGRL